MHPLQIPPPLPSSFSQATLACLPSLTHPRTAGKHKREENFQVDLQEPARNLIWICFLAVSHKNYYLNRTARRRMVRQCRFSTKSADCRQRLVWMKHFGRRAIMSNVDRYLGISCALHVAEVVTL